MCMCSLRGIWYCHQDHDFLLSCTIAVIIVHIINYLILQRLRTRLLRSELQGNMRILQGSVEVRDHKWILSKRM